MGQIMIAIDAKRNLTAGDPWRQKIELCEGKFYLQGTKRMWRQ